MLQCFGTYLTSVKLIITSHEEVQYTHKELHVFPIYIDRNLENMYGNGYGECVTKVVGILSWKALKMGLR